MKIAFLGCRGIPANYGGFETITEELSTALAKRGHQVIVYGRKGNSKTDLKEYMGVRLYYMPQIRGKITETFSSTFFAMFHVLFQDIDIIYVMNSANSPLCVLPWILRKKVIINVDGLDWKRKKWGRIARQYYQWAEKLATYFSTRILTDSLQIKKYYAEKYKINTTFIAYGAHIEDAEIPGILEKYNLTTGNYFFITTRLEPENNTDLAVKAFEKIHTNKKLVIAGGANYKSRYVQKLTSTKDPRVIFLGPLYHAGHLKELYCNCFAYIHGNEVGGTNPGLLKAMGFGNTVLALDTKFNSEVLQDTGILFAASVDDLVEKMQYLIDNPTYCRSFKEKAQNRIRENYTWKKITDQYEKLFEDVVNGTFG